MAAVAGRAVTEDSKQKSNMRMSSHGSNWSGAQMMRSIQQEMERTVQCCSEEDSARQRYRNKRDFKYGYAENDI
eukprot:scaffold45222_cov20-Tisochrysis_lutea.AAC.2